MRTTRARRLLRRGLFLARVRALEILAKTEKLFDDSTSVNIVHRSSDEIYKELQEALSGFDLDMN